MKTLTADDILAKYSGEPDAPEPQAAAPAKATSRPITGKDLAALQAKIKAGELPMPSTFEQLLSSLKESNQAAGESLGRQTLFGVPGRVMDAAASVAPDWMKADRAQPIPGAGQGDAHRPEDYAPTESTLASLPAAAVDMATVGGAFGKAGNAIGQAPAQIAKRLGASEAATVARPSIQAAANTGGAGAAFGATDAALRGGDVGDIATGAGEGALANVLMSHVPAAAAKVEDLVTDAITHRAVRPLLATGQGKAANKAQLALGKGDKQAGKVEMGKVIAEEGLEPTIRRSPADLANVVQDRLDQIGYEDLGPVRSIALQHEPGAKVSTVKAREALRATLTDDNKGTAYHDDIEKAIALLDERAARIGSKGQLPVKTLLSNAREFEKDGYGKTEAKFSDGESARAIGRTLRVLADSRIGSIYAKNPQLVKQAIGRQAKASEPKTLETGEANPDYEATAPDWKASRALASSGLDPEATTAKLDMETLGEKYADAKRRYSRLAAIQPAAEQLSSRMSQERSPGLINTVATSGKRLLGAGIGGAAGGAPGAIIGAGVADIAGRAVDPFQRAARLGARLVGPGPAIDAYSAPTLANPEWRGVGPAGAMSGVLLDDIVKEKERENARKDASDAFEEPRR